ncbi:Dynamin family protein [Alkaliphilus metalliredigens QYMF]|uniref:Dynamin family protein n=2 Tax=Alkaliphilus TaxID=114627 RepID=A6TT65_ALKMQ|nr:Dynamin family protein [Alkaliphilus metalliredigens QYMF]
MLKDFNKSMKLYVNHLRNMEAIARDLDYSLGVKKCGDLLNRVEELEFHVAVMGQFKRGKTTILNYFIGKEILPTGVVPITAITTKIKYGNKPQAKIIFQGDLEKSVDINSIGEYISEQKNPENKKKVKQVEVYLPAEVLENGLVLIDTPGIGSTYKHNTEAAYNYLSEANAVILVMSADTPVGEAEIGLLSQVKKYIDKIFFLQNKVDYLSQAEVEESLHFSKEVIAETIGIEPRIYPVSAKLALEGKVQGDFDKINRSGINKFEDTLYRFLLKDKETYLMKSYGNKLIEIVSALYQHLDFKTNILISDIEVIEEKVNAFKNRLQETMSMKKEVQVMVEIELEEIIKSFEKNLEEFKVQQTKNIINKISQAAKGNKHIHSKELSQLLNQRLELEIEKAYNDWNSQQEVVIRQSYEEITSRLRDKLNEVIVEINNITYDLFKTKIVQPVDEFHLIDRDTFYFKFGSSSAPFLTPKLKDFMFVLPRSIRNRKIISDTLNRVDNEIEKNGNNLKWDYTCKIKDSKYIFERTFQEYINSTVDDLMTIIDKTKELKTKEDSHIQKEIEFYQDRKVELRKIEGEIEALEVMV